ncbi:MAG: hypothetical protein AAFV07_13605 [Bacteroidota bacterium]
MKRFTFFLTFATLVVFASSSFAQHKPGFGSFSIQNTTLNGEWAFGAGGIGGGYLTPSILVGGGGYGISGKQPTQSIHMGYGGFLVGYDWLGEEKTNSLLLYVLGGYGAMEVRNETGVAESDFWVIQPNVEVEFPLLGWARLGLGGGYRLVMDTDIANLSNQAFSGPFGSISIRFGDFQR